MAQQVKFGEPVNESERWAFSLLASKLPEHYSLFTNLELITHTGQPFEVDALVVGDYGVYVIDVKGYVGQLRIDSNVWELDGRAIDNSLSKANYLARVLAGRLKTKTSSGEHAPWCQGMVFVTGQQGQSISLVKSDKVLCVFDSRDIIASLTKQSYITSDHQFRVTPKQKDLVLDVIGNVSAIENRKGSIQDFRKKSCLLKDEGFEVWEAEYVLGDWKTSWLLKLVIPGDFANLDQSNRHVEDLKEEYFRNQQLGGIAGIPSYAPLIFDGDQVALPIKRPMGQQLFELDIESLGSDLALSILRRGITALEQIHARGCSLGDRTASDVFVSGDGDVVFLSPLFLGDSTADYGVLKNLFKEVARVSGVEEIKTCFDDLSDANGLAELQLLIAQALSATGEDVLEEAELKTDSILGGKYKLLEKLSESSVGQTWRARHLEGQFDCALSTYFKAGEFWASARQELYNLLPIYHPSLERIFEVDSIESLDLYYLSRAWVPGLPLRDALDEYGLEESRGYLSDLLVALQYLHRRGLGHKNISPENIICGEKTSTLIGFSGLPDTFSQVQDIAYLDPQIKELGWSPESDVYSLLASLVLSISEEKSPEVLTNLRFAFLTKLFDSRVVEQIENFFRDRPLFSPGTDYLDWFALKNSNSKIEDLPEGFRGRWNISQGYMTFLALDMLNDRRPRSRNQWILNALRSRRIAGNKINRNSMNATISRLKSVGVVEAYGKKIRATQGFLEDYDSNG